MLQERFPRLYIITAELDKIICHIKVKEKLTAPRASLEDEVLENFYIQQLQHVITSNLFLIDERGNNKKGMIKDVRTNLFPDA